MALFQASTHCMGSSPAASTRVVYHESQNCSPLECIYLSMFCLTGACLSASLKVLQIILKVKEIRKFIMDRQKILVRFAESFQDTFLEEKCTRLYLNIKLSLTFARTQK